ETAAAAPAAAAPAAAAETAIGRGLGNRCGENAPDQEGDGKLAQHGSVLLHSTVDPKEHASSPRAMAAVSIIRTCLGERGSGTLMIVLNLAENISRRKVGRTPR